MSATAEANPGLDRVMLAMDVVDTLRHQQSLVEAELDDDRRQYALVDRVRAIYESQGIEVSESVIREGVRALRDNRFVYAPPRRTFAVRLAEIYVERGKWARRLAIVALIGLLVWAAFAVPRHFRRESLMDGFERSVIALETEKAQLAGLAGQLEQRLERSRAVEGPGAAERLQADAEDALLDGMGRLDAVGSALTGIPTPDVYVEDRERWDVAMGSYTSMAADARTALGSASGLLDAVEQLRAQQGRLDETRQRLSGIGMSASEQVRIAALVQRVEAAIAAGEVEAGDAALFALDTGIDAVLAARQRQSETRAQFASLSTALDGVALDPDAERELKALAASVEQAIAAEDWERAGVQVAALRRLVGVLDVQYELRIVSRGNERSGVWRYPDGNRGKRNYYIVVEAIGPGGKPLSLPIESEEDQSVREVRRFGVRVPEAVYERVKADKLDNGLIDDVVFGSKRRGAREPEYRFPVAGGRITRW